jgi:hypothetical protein
MHEVSKAFTPHKILCILQGIMHALPINADFHAWALRTTTLLLTGWKFTITAEANISATYHIDNFWLN